uniref:Pentatricopeptide repeat protein n=1 Tax=Salvia miltiorrhiza TaxID=226208 RepID=A0A678WDM9_SALMI|nr:pentatricopeptide repeat protein [Salvia miltiorrhiza]
MHSRNYFSFGHQICGHKFQIYFSFSFSFSFPCGEVSSNFKSPSRVRSHQYTYQLFLERVCCSRSKLAAGTVISAIALRKAPPIIGFSSKPNAYSLVHLIRDCTTNSRFSHGQQLHSYLLKSGFISNVFVSTSLINFYVKFELVHDAHHLFDEIPEPSVVSWNSLISGYVHSGKFHRALNLFCQLERSNLAADSYSFTAALCACGQLSRVREGKSLHSKILKYGAECSIFVANCLIDMYGKCSCVSDAMKVFGDMAEKDDISWNSVLAANARNGALDQAFAVFCRMPNPDTISYNELIDGIAKFGVVEDAVTLLSRMPNPNSSSWNAIITGYANRGRGRDAVRFFCKMHSCRIRMDEFTFSSVLSSIAGLAALTLGSLTHCCALKCGLDEYVVVGSALTDMYFKCGAVEEAERSFESLPERNLVTWNALMSGYAHNGDPRKVFELFKEMKGVKDLEPDEITFLNVLSACWHGRVRLDVVRGYFDVMRVEYGIDPMPEHCCLMIKVMGQEGDVRDAEEMIGELGFGSCGMVWRALLGACVSCGDVGVAEVAARKVVERRGEKEVVYVSLSNVYAAGEIGTGWRG